MNNMFNVNFASLNGLSNIFTDDLNTNSLETNTINGLNISSYLGVTGAQGATGTVIYSGPTGATGLQGLTGATGAEGRTGIQGYMGVTGSTGAQGIQGNVIYVGATGATGCTGSTGQVIYVGETGSTGATGARGQVIYVGETGTTGSTGSTGMKGDNGGVPQLIISTVSCDGNPANVWLNTYNPLLYGFGINLQKGDKGDMGNPGQKGDTGDTGSANVGSILSGVISGVGLVLGITAYATLSAWIGAISAEVTGLVASVSSLDIRTTALEAVTLFMSAFPGAHPMTRFSSELTINSGIVSVPITDVILLEQTGDITNTGFTHTTGDIRGGSLTSTSTITASGQVQGGSINSTSTITATGLINGSSIQGNNIVSTQTNPLNGYISAGGVLNVGTNYNPLLYGMTHNINGSILNVNCSITNFNGEVNFVSAGGQNFSMSGFMNQYNF